MLQFRVGALRRRAPSQDVSFVAACAALCFAFACSAPEGGSAEDGVIDEDEGANVNDDERDDSGDESPDEAMGGSSPAPTGGRGGTAGQGGAAMARDAGRLDPSYDAPDGGVRADALSTKPASMMYVAVGWGGRRTSSVDGATWMHEQVEARPGGDDNNLLRGVGYGAGLFVAVGGGPNIRMLVTRDGRTWTRPNHPSGQWLGGVAYGNGVWVAVGGLGRRMMSTDGMTWKDVSGSGSHLRSVAFANGRFVAAGSGLCTSTADGQQWTRPTSCGANAERVAGGGGRWVVVGYAGRSFAGSSDGQSWTTGTLPSDSRNGIAYGKGRFYVAAGSGLLTSIDGTQWQPQPSGAVSVLAFDGYDKLLGAQNGTLKVSSDGMAWMNGTPSGNSIMGIAGGPLLP